MAKKVLTNGTFKFNNTPYFYKSITFSEKVSMIDLTDTGTVGDAKEQEPGRVERTFSGELWVYDNQNTIPTKVKGAIEIDMNGLKFAGSGSVNQKDVKGDIDNGVAYSFQGSFYTPVTEATGSL